jgi:hypothetical protein
MKVTKPRPGVKIATFIVPPRLTTTVHDVLLVPASQWVVPHKIVNKLEPRLVSTWNYKEAHGALLQAFNTISTTEATLVSNQIRRYAAKCALYAQSRPFLTEFTKSFEARKLVIEKDETRRNIESLASQSISTAVNILKGALSTVEKYTLEILESIAAIETFCLRDGVSVD